MPTFDLEYLEKEHGDCENYHTIIKLFKLEGKKTYTLPVNRIDWAVKKLSAASSNFGENWFCVVTNSAVGDIIRNLKEDYYRDLLPSVSTFGPVALKQNLRLLHKLQAETNSK